MKLISLLPFVASIGCVQTGDAPPVLLDAGFDEVVEKLLAVLHVPGLSLAVIDGDNITTKGYGFAQLPGVPATADTIWYTGSTTKAFTGAAAGVLVQDNKNYPNVKWSTPVSQLLPGDFVLNREYETSHTTLEDALSHRSGLSSHNLAYGWNNASALDIVRTLRDLPLSAEPRTKWQYCNLMFATVGAVIERVTGKDLESVLRHLFWEPIGMISTTFSVTKARSLKDSNGNSRLARGYYWQGEHYIPEPCMDITPVAGAGATLSSVNDYTLWIKALLEPRMLNQSSPITGSLYEDMMTPRSIVNLPGIHGIETPRYSLGWMLLSIDGRPLITHGGATIGYGSEVFMLPNERFGFVTMANRDSPGNLIGNMLFLQLLKRRFPDWEENAAEQTLRQLRADSIPYGPSPRPLTSPSRSAMARRASSPRIPLPGELDDYTGLYSHPAYGVVNVSREIPWGREGATQRPEMNDQQRPLLPIEAADNTDELFIRPSKRMWPGSWYIRHEFLTYFHAEMYVRHGIDEEQRDIPDCASTRSAGDRSLECRIETVYEFWGDSRAAFEYDSNGNVRWLGLQPDPEVAEYSREKGGDQFIWFERI